MRGAEGGEGGSFASERRYTEPLPISPSALRGLIPGGGRRWWESMEDWWSAALMGDYTC